MPEGAPKTELLDKDARQGRNDFKRIGYGGPCPPPGKPHRYFFKLYALDAKLDVKAGAGRNELEPAMKRHILSQTEWMVRTGDSVDASKTARMGRSDALCYELE